MAQSISVRRTELLGSRLRRFARRGARTHVSKLLGRTRPEDVALVFPDLTPEEQEIVFEVLISEYPESAGEFLTELEPSERRRLLENRSAQQIAKLLEEMSVDDAVEVVDSLPDDLRQEVLEIVDRRDLAHVQAHLTYAEDSAGRIMDPEFFALPRGTLIRDAVDAIHEARNVEMIFYLYVLDEDDRLVGVTSLRQLLLARLDQSLDDVMTRSVIKVGTHTDQEEIAELAARYDLLAIPVTDEDNRLVGIVTVDDIMDVFIEEADEDLFKMVGSSNEELLFQGRSWRIAFIRLPWLLANLVGGAITGYLLWRFQVSLRETLFLLTFVPVIMGMGGNIASQTSTITVRGMATGRIALQGRTLSYLWHQVKVGAIIGLICAALVAVVAYFMETNSAYAAVVGVSLFLAIVFASLNGAIVPILFERLGIDPAVAAGPLVTTSNDITGILIYFTLALALIDLLVK
jgi:magnesium transporter